MTDTRTAPAGPAMLAQGTRLGPYEIVASLGRGGMRACGCGERAAGVPNAGPTRGSRAWDPNAAAALEWPMRVEPRFKKC